jgi:hypothetical protein
MVFFNMILISYQLQKKEGIGFEVVGFQSYDNEWTNFK